MFNWLIAQKKTEKVEKSVPSDEEEVEEVEEESFEIPTPPSPDMGVALRIKNKKYFPQYHPEDLKSEIVEDYIDREIRKMKKNQFLKELKEEITLEYSIRKDKENLRKFFMDKIAKELERVYVEKEIENVKHEIKKHFEEDWNSEESSSEELFFKKRLRTSLSEDNEFRVSNEPIYNEPIPVFDWKEPVKDWDIEMGFGSPITEKDMQRISKEIGNEWSDMPALIEDHEYQENPFENTINDPINIDFNIKETFGNNKMNKVERENPEGYLELFMGPMFSGKSSKVVFKLTSMADQGFKCLYVNSVKDERETEVQDSAVTTHNSAYSKLSKKIDTVKVSSLSEVSVSDYDYIAVDELQFFDDESTVRCITDWTAIYGKYVLVASLDGDCYRRKFGKVLDLIPHADEVTKLTAYCDICRDNYRILKKAPFTARMTSDTSAELVGGKDLYKAMCRSCHDFHLDVTVNYF